MNDRENVAGVPGSDKIKQPWSAPQVEFHPVAGVTQSAPNVGGDANTCASSSKSGS